MDPDLPFHQGASADHGGIVQNNVAGGNVFAPVIKVDLGERRQSGEQVVVGNVPQAPPAFQPREDGDPAGRAAGR